MTIYLIGIDQMILPLTKKLVDEGGFPNLKKVLQESASNQVIPAFPGWTPTNWATIATGADTGTHGVFSWQIEMPKGEKLTSFHSFVVNAETIWEAAEKNGLKSAMIHYPASMPSRIEQGYVIDGDGVPGYGENRFEVAPSMCYTNLDLPNAEKIEISKAENWKNIKLSEDALETEMKITSKFKGEDKILHILILNSEGKGFNRIKICKDKDLETMISEIDLGAWSDWVFEDFIIEEKNVTGTFRFKLMELSTEAKEFRLYRSQIMPTTGFSEPDSIGKELVDKIGPYQEHVSEYSSILGWTDYETVLEEADYQAQWFADAALYLSEEKKIDIFYSHWHFLDDLNHHHLGHVDPSWSNFKAEERDEHWQIIRKTYEIIDRYIGKIIERMTERDYLIIISDHGNLPVSRQIWLEKFLQDKGFLVRKDNTLPLFTNDDNWSENIDWQKTKVYLRDGVTNDFSIYINAEGATKERIANDLIRELRVWVDEKTNKTPIAIALKKSDAAIFGCWGEDIGDVVIVLEPEYQITSLGEQSDEENKWINSVAGVITASHGQQILTHQTDVSSHLAMFTIMGPKIKRGYMRDPNLGGYIKMVDIVPTLCHILGIVPPSQSQGAIAYDLMIGHEMTRNRTTEEAEKREIDERVIKQRDMHDYDVLQNENYMEILRKMRSDPDKDKNMYNKE